MDVGITSLQNDGFNFLIVKVDSQHKRAIFEMCII